MGDWEITDSPFGEVLGFIRVVKGYYYYVVFEIGWVILHWLCLLQTSETIKIKKNALQVFDKKAKRLNYGFYISLGGAIN